MSDTHVSTEENFDVVAAKENRDYEKMHFTASVLTLEETLCNEVEIKNCIDRIAYQYVFEKKNIVLERLYTRVISSIEFDGIIPYIGENGLTRYVVENKYQVPDNYNKQNAYLKEQFEDFLNYKNVER